MSLKTDNYPINHHDELLELKDVLGASLRLNARIYRVGLLIPMSGAAGIWAPSCIASAQVAAYEVNRAGGIAGKDIQLILIDAASESEDRLVESLSVLLEDGAIDAIVGMHISAVRNRLSKLVSRRIPYVYTPLYEGGEETLGLFCIGETPAIQLAPAIDYLTQHFERKRWALIGNNYVWPRKSNAFAREKITGMGGEICFETYVDFGHDKMKPLVQEIKDQGADIVLITLVGQDSVSFNRAFGALKLQDQMFRLSCAVEENALLACGAQNLKNLYSTSSYFSVLDSSENQSFKEIYYQFHGEHAPTLNMLGQSTYEGVQFLASLIKHHPSSWKDMGSDEVDKIDFKSVRRKFDHAKQRSFMPVYLARAQGHGFEIVEKIYN